MQHTTNNNAEEILKTIPEHFPETSPNTTSTTNSRINSKPLAATADRPQNFSFSSSYTASRFGNNIPSNRLSTTLPTTHFDFKPISAFAVLNADDLATSSYIAKPNAIVRPFRRPEQPLPGPLHTNDSDSPDAAQSQQQQQESGISVVAHYGNEESTPFGQEARSFVEELNRKLRFLNTRESFGSWNKSPTSSKHGSQQESLNKRPLFITTVPTGIFLPPTREPPLPPTYQQRIYAYSSHPVVFSSGTYNYKHNKHPTHSYNYNNYNYNKTNNNNKTNTTAFSKDKLRSSTAPIVAADKKFTTQTTNAAASSASRNDMRGSGPTVRFGGVRGEKRVGGSTHSPPLGGVQITKQQFQQQLQQHRAKRETPAPEPYKNVMYERRVVRGSNFGGTNLLADTDPFDKAAELRRRQALRKKTQCRNQRNILGTPPPVKGRRHEVIQTEKYLEELVQRPPEFSIDTQTDLFLEKPPTPPYIPFKVGVDKGTEIGEGELFHFDAEAQPIIEILVDACIEQSMLEVAHEQELSALRKKQEEYLAQREAELAELRRLEAEELRLQAEKVRRLRQDVIAKELDEEMQKGVTAAKLLQGHIAGLLPEVLENLEPATDAAKKEQLMKTICPWLSAEVAEEVGQIVDSREILTVIIQEIIKQRATVYAGYMEEIPEVTGALQAKYDDEEEGQGEMEPECCLCETEESDGCPPPAE